MSRRWRSDETPKSVFPPGAPRSICVLIFTYNRPDELRRLLSDVAATQGPYDVTVHVFDDCSPQRAEECREFVAKHGWHWHDATEHHGKRQFWKLVTDAYSYLRTLEHDLFVSVPDDARLASDFFDRAVRAWLSIGDKHACLNVWRDPRDHCWTGQTPRDVNELVRETGWVDGAFAAPRSYFDVPIRPVPPEWWKVNPNRGSGVGQRVTTALVDMGRRVYQVRGSLMAHAGCRVSQMNPEERLEHPLRAHGFVDGQRVCDALELQEPVLATLASIPRRVALLECTVASLLPQVDELGVFLNGYNQIPAFLDHPRIVVARSQDHEDRGDAGKFFWKPERGYHLTCDDDLVYPPDYVRRMIEGIEAYEREAVVSFHGAQVIHGTFSSRCIFHCTRRLPEDVRAHLPGTGVLGYHADLRLRFNFSEDFKHSNMADVWAAVKAKREQVPVYVRKHDGGWVVAQRDPESRTIYQHFAGRSDVQDRIIREAAPWPRFARPIL